jgi:tetratricopeptide (TPR) repeat protein
MRADRLRCPRCRAHVQIADPAVAAAAASATARRLRRVVVSIAVGCAIVVAVLWALLPPGREPANRGVHAADPLAALRPAGPVERPPAIPGAPAEAPPFLDPSGAATLAYSAGDYEGALRQLQLAVERNPQDAESLSNLGQVLVRLGRTAEAIPCYERAIGIMPDRWAYHFNLARALGLMGKWREAIASYGQAQELFPDDYVTKFNLALALHKSGDDEGAIAEYKKAIELNPDDPSFWLALAVSFEHAGEAADAVSSYGEYLRLSPSAGDADKVKARIAVLTGAATPETSPATAVVPVPGEVR